MNNSCNGVTHIIKKGDTLYSLSRKYGVKLVDVLRANPYVNVYNLMIGEEICIPTAMMEMEEEYYEVMPGDTIGTILKATGKSFDELFEMNGELQNVVLPLGMYIKINK